MWLTKEIPLAYNANPTSHEIIESTSFCRCENSKYVSGFVVDKSEISQLICFLKRRKCFHPNRLCSLAPIGSSGEESVLRLPMGVERDFPNKLKTHYEARQTGKTFLCLLLAIQTELEVW